MGLVLTFHHHSKIMKKVFIIFSVIAFITSCNIVETPYMVDSGTTNPIDTNTYIQKILIEDFTGHTCPNCPEAAAELEAIQELYGDQVIGIALHVGSSFANPWNGAGKFEYDFRTKWGEEIDGFFNVSTSGLPKGLINRTGYPNEHKVGKDEWHTKVQNILNNEPLFGIDIQVSATGVNITSKALDNINGDFKLVVCLTEDNIINWQKVGTTEDEFYNHKHVLRTFLNDSWTGDLLKESSNSYINGEEIEKSYTINLSDLEQFNIDYSNNSLVLGNGNAGGWNANNMHVVAYIYNNDTYEIVQVEETHLTH